MNAKTIIWTVQLALCSALLAQDLPVEIQADLLLTKVKKSIDKNDWAGAAKNLKNLKALDVELPDEFHYNFGKALGKAGNHAESLKEILIYLHKSGGSGKYEKEAMEVFLNVKNTGLPAAPTPFPEGMPLARKGALLAASVQDNSKTRRAGHTVADCRQLEAMDVELPADFLFLYGRALLEAKQYKPARERLTAFFKEQGREAPHYQEALKLFLSLDELDKQAAKEAMLRKERDKELAAAREHMKKGFVIPKVELEMMPVPAGDFMMGSPSTESSHDSDERQYRAVISRPYWLGKHEVTQEQWSKIMRNTVNAKRLKSGSRKFLKDLGALRMPTSSKSSKFRTYDSNGKGPNHPMYNISWNDALVFCQKLTELERRAGRLPVGYVYTLPTEAEWEYACRAGTTTPTAFGAALSSRQANFKGGEPYGGAAKGPDLKRSCAVGSYPPNAWGLHDMHGNVWEMCWDWYGSKYPTSERTDPTGPRSGKGHVYRGGSCLNGGRYCRSAYRGSSKANTPDYYGSGIGFRLCLSAVPRI